jgi:hypothetical protein
MYCEWISMYWTLSSEKTSHTFPWSFSVLKKRVHVSALSDSVILTSFDRAWSIPVPHLARYVVWDAFFPRSINHSLGKIWCDLEIIVMRWSRGISQWSSSQYQFESPRTIPFEFLPFFVRQVLSPITIDNCQSSRQKKKSVREIESNGHACTRQYLTYSAK